MDQTAAAKRTVIGLLAALMLAGCGDSPKSPSRASALVSVIPAPSKIEQRAGEFVLDDETRLEFGDGVEGERLGGYLIDLVQRTHGGGLNAGAGEVGNNPGAKAIRFELSADGSGGERYSLVSSPERVVISAGDSRGLFYGAVTLWQLMSKRDGGLVLPVVTIEDSPRFSWRGLMLDSARHYQPPEFIRKFIDVMALHKFNVLHWHLTDDQAWRLEIKKYPRLTEVGAWRVPAGAAPAADIDPGTGKPRLYGGFYSQEEVREIVAYAKDRNITIVPEIDMPGHASAAIAAYPQLAVIDRPSTQVPADWGVYPNLFNVEESTFQFLQDVLAEVIALFPSEYIHVGGDEAVKDQWKASARVQARMRELGLKDEHEMQSYFIKRMETFLSSQGRRLIGWDEILEGGLPPKATVMSWRGIDGAVAAATAGHDTVLSPQPTLYFDRRPVDLPTLPGRASVVTTEEVYAFDPVPAALNEEQRKHILGVQANIWVEHIRTLERVELMTFPRAAALAEVAWSPVKDWASFSARLPAQLERYRALDVRYAEALPPRSLDPFRRSSHELALCSDKIRLSLEDDAPVTGDRAVFLVDILDPCWVFKDADLSKVQSLVAAVGQVPFNFQIGDAVKQIPLPPPATAAGELEVRIGDCKGERIAVLPLAPAVGNHAVTTLPPAQITPREGKHDLCFTFTRKSIDPTWVIDSIALQTTTAAATE
ncbi:family 20 glycosylhydrolase [Steroidobacter sp. S1-65]|uniref:beta-N-acetylhexosaminidase n=1 Tax=Steroidobacter gossypii TaxID=2805490 RepID=A0ABS1X204_9GAMM|nr:family 20 glycosylhydrolase [Steroidobacter gossypii]MBM0107273.1 family 20 glycosylhydrolase [Steroidobacter gossypii]